jgi:hypothetical protein
MGEGTDLEEPGERTVEAAAGAGGLLMMPNIASGSDESYCTTHGGASAVRENGAALQHTRGSKCSQREWSCVAPHTGEQVQSERMELRCSSWRRLQITAGVFEANQECSVKGLRERGLGALEARPITRVSRRTLTGAAGARAGAGAGAGAGGGATATATPRGAALLPACVLVSLSVGRGRPACSPPPSSQCMARLPPRCCWCALRGRPCMLAW